MRSPLVRHLRQMLPARRLAAAAAAGVVALWPGRAAVAQEAQDAPAPQALVARITALKGIVQVRNAEDQPWKPAEVGMELNEGGEFRTGPRSAVQFVIPPDQTITLDRLGTIKVLQAVQDAGKVTTALGMEYGRARYDVQAADLQHDATIRSPGSTLAIRGTDVTYEDMAPFPPAAVSREGRAEFRNARRQTVAFGGTGRASVDAESDSPAETALVDTRSDPQSEFSGRSEAEEDLVLELPSFGGTDLATGGITDIQDQTKQQEMAGDIIPPPAPPPSTQQRLMFELTWSGTPFNDLDLQIARGDNEIVFGGPLGGPIPPGVTSGGQHAGNQEANSIGDGAEQVIWSPDHPPDFYLVTVLLRNNATSLAQVKVTRDPGGANEAVVGQFNSIPMNIETPVFQAHVPIPPERTDPPPPIPPHPIPEVLPPPQPGPDNQMTPDPPPNPPPPAAPAIVAGER